MVPQKDAKITFTEYPKNEEKQKQIYVQSETFEKKKEESW